MLRIDDTVISPDLTERFFQCVPALCKGECCIEGDAGAPLEKEEFSILQKILPVLWDDLSHEAKKVIEKQGIGYIDSDNDIVTSIVEGKNCVFTYHDTDGVCKCAIEKAYSEGRTDFKKPLSCSLYPVRVTQHRDFKAVNYHRWKICRSAEVAGKEKGIAVYQFLKEPLIQKFGKEWYDALDCYAKEYTSNEKQT